MRRVRRVVVHAGRAEVTEPPTVDLSGDWQACVADETLRRTWLDTASGEASQRWVPTTVPGHWRSTETLAHTDGPVLYRRTFDLVADPDAGKRWWLELDGIFYQGDVWLDGAYVGDTEGYFFPHRFEVTDLLAGRGGRSEHTLGVEVACPRPDDRTAKRAITGVFQHWDCLDPDWNPGGIWRPVRLRPTGAVAIRRLQVLCQEATPERAVLACSAVLDASEATTATIETTVACIGTTAGGIDHVVEQPLAAGENHVQWRVEISQPLLWWPHMMGDQPLYKLDMNVRAGPDGLTSDRRTLTTGLRSVRLRDWIFHINGERMFLKGANQGPSPMALGDADGDELLARDIALARDAGLDLLRVHAHISRTELYEHADRAGLLLWQDFPLQWGYDRSIRKEAARQATHAVELLGHHPSVVLWCGHNEPFALDHEPGTPLEPAKLATSFLVSQELPGWNKTVLDRTVKRALSAADGTRPVIAHSGVFPHPPKFDGTDSHLYFGWYHGEERDFPAFARRVPRMVRFVSEFGAQAIPDSADFCDPDRWPDLDWHRLARTHGLQRERFDRYVPPDLFDSFEAWRDATQAYQATLLKHHIETLRRLKYRPAGGFAMFSFADGHPAVSWSVLDHRRVPKAGFYALVDACRPVIVVADRPPLVVHSGDQLRLDVHVVSDLRVPIGEATV
ncbi:MAG: glycoside hydrolase family 2 TIM barrel-domain containing protein, partial [Acidimicrobiales bacterium]